MKLLWSLMLCTTIAGAQQLADFVLLDRDLTQIPAPEIRHVRVLATVVGGETVYEGGR